MINLDEAGRPTFTLPPGTQYSGNGSERFGFGAQPNGPQPHVTFYPKALQQNYDSLLQGKPIFKSVVMVKVIQPGERDILDRMATKEDAQRWPNEYRAYCEGREDAPNGIPLAVLFPHHGDVVQALQFHRIFTVEQLAHLNDTQKQNLGMGGYEWSQKAQRYLEALSAGQGFAKLEHANERQAIEIKRQQDVIDQLTREVYALKNQLTAIAGVTTGGLNTTRPPAAAAIPQMHQPQPQATPGGGVFVAAGPGELGAEERRGPAAPLPSTPDIFHEDQAAAVAGEPAPSARRQRR